MNRVLLPMIVAWLSACGPGKAIVTVNLRGKNTTACPSVTVSNLTITVGSARDTAPGAFMVKADGSSPPVILRIPKEHTGSFVVTGYCGGEMLREPATGTVNPSGKVEVALPVDFAVCCVVPDMAVPLDLAVPVDMSTPTDTAPLVDMTMPPDLTCGAQGFCNGQCTPLDTGTNCGACGKKCGQGEQCMNGGCQCVNCPLKPHATSSCVNNQCSPPVCVLGYGDCNNDLNNDLSDGCEDNVANNPMNCGMGGPGSPGCGHVCSFLNATPACVNGACVIKACNPLFGDCDGNPANGCEANLQMAAMNCGACGVVCVGPKFCQAGVCTCPNPQRDCAGTCTDIASDVKNCGACGRACGVNGLGPTCAGAGKCCSLGWNFSKDYTVGTYPEGPVTGDFNKDGWIDLAVANSLDKTISILINQGQGNFAPAIPPTQPVGPASGRPVAADLDNDGWIDIAVPNSGDSTITLLWNDRNGGFVPGALLKTGTAPSALAAVDIDGKNGLDLVVDNYGSGNNAGNVGWFLNRGNQVFAPMDSLSVGRGTEDPDVGDVTGDGAPDVVVANILDNSVTVLRNQKVAPFFVVHQTILNVGGGSPAVVRLVDFDRKNGLDLAVANITGNSVSVFLNNGQGMFAMLGEYPVNLNNQSVMKPQGMVVGDFDFDKLPDVAVAGVDSSDVWVMRNTGGNALQAAVRLTGNGNTLNRPLSLVTADFNNDGGLDFAVPYDMGSKVSIWLMKCL